VDLPPYDRLDLPRIDLLSHWCQVVLRQHSLLGSAKWMGLASMSDQHCVFDLDLRTNVIIFSFAVFRLNEFGNSLCKPIEDL